MDTASTCLEFSEWDPGSWSFTQHPQRADNKCMTRASISLHYFFCFEHWELSGFSVLTFYNFLLSDPTKFLFFPTLFNHGHPTKFLFFPMLFNHVLSHAFQSCSCSLLLTHMSGKILQIGSCWYFLIEKKAALSVRISMLCCRSHTGHKENLPSHGVLPPPLTFVLPLFFHCFCFLCPCSVFCLFLNTFSQRHHYHC